MCKAGIILFAKTTNIFISTIQENPYTETKRFDWIRGDIVGGRSLLWARACYRWSDLDFEANLRDGHGVDWPIRYKDIAPWYDYVESFIGVSGNRDGVSVVPDGNFQPPFEMNAVEKYFKEQDRIKIYRPESDHRPNRQSYPTGKGQGPMPGP